MASGPSEKYRVYDSPRISANQLAEYVLASPSRRQTILKNAKFAPTFLVIRYSAARAAICKFLVNEARPVAILDDAANEQADLAKSAETDFAKNDAALSFEAIKAFRGIANEPHLTKASFFLNSQNLPKLEISEVAVSVNLDLVARNAHKETVGGVVLQTSKAVASKSWRDDHSKNVASLIWMLAEKHMTGLGKIDRRLCLAVDAIGRRVVPAPTNYKKRLNDIEAACGEISVLWPSISPPPDLG